MKLIDLSGMVFGELTVIRRNENRKDRTYWIAKCTCGNVTEVEGGNLRSGHTKTCGHCKKYERVDAYTMRCRLPTGQSFIFDMKDYPTVKRHKWSIEDSGYVHTTEGGKHIRLHRVLLGVPTLTVDHINGDKSDNRKSNLRVCTNQENLWNQRIRSDNTSGYKGVCLDKRRNKYEAAITVSGKKKFLGYYDSAEEAAKAYDQAASFYFGEFARLNCSREEEYVSNEILEVAV